MNTAALPPPPGQRAGVVWLVGEQRQHHQRHPGGQRAENGAGPAVGDHHPGRAEHLVLRYEPLGVRPRRQRPERDRVGGVADRDQDPDRQVGQRVEHGRGQAGNRPCAGATVPNDT